MRRIVIVVKRERALHGGWAFGSPKDHRLGDSLWCKRKADAVLEGRRICLDAAARGEWAQLRVYGPRGLQYERTYPRKSDPKRSKG